MAISTCMAYGIGGVCNCSRKICGDAVQGLRGWIHDNQYPEIYVGF